MLLIVKQEITEQVDKLVQERVAECLKTHTPQELQDEVASSNREPQQNQPYLGSQLLHTGLPMSPLNPPSALQGPSAPTLSYTISSPVYPPNPFGPAHSSNGLGITLPPLTSATPSLSDAKQLDVDSRTSVPRAAAKLTIKNTDGTEISLESLAKSAPTPSTPAISSPQSLVHRQGSPGIPNRRLTSIDTEDQLAEQEQNDRLKSEAAEIPDEIRDLEEAAWLENEQKERHRKEEEWLRNEAEDLELRRLKEEAERRLKLKQEEEDEEGILNAKQEEESIRTEAEDQLAEREQSYKLEAEAAKATDEIRDLEEAAWLENERCRKEAEDLELQLLKEEEERILKLEQEEEEERILKGKQEGESTRTEAEDQLAEQEQSDRLMAEAAKVADEIRELEEAAWLENERCRKEAEDLELQRLKEEEDRRLKLEQEEERILKAKQEEESIRTETEDQLAEQEKSDRLEAEAAKVADEIRELEEAAWLENERYRKEAEDLELQRLKEEEERRLRLEQEEEEERILKAKQEEEMALRLAQERAEEEKEGKEKEEGQERERLSKLAEETRLRLEEETATKVMAEANSEPEPEEREEAELEAHNGEGKQDEQLEDGNTETSKSMEDGKYKPKDGLRINTIAINSPMSDRRRPGPLDLTGAIRSASPVVAALATARFIADITAVPYPEGFHGPHPDLNQNVKNGKFRYH